MIKFCIRNGGIRFDGTREQHAVHDGHLHVENHEIKRIAGRRFAKDFQRFLPPLVDAF